ncbi:MAG: DEAD/DEAH box helicase [Planctomycetes bacterium]|nr:DEAD/DEAH box helicase [Planctomycetota bacterium]MBI3843497.1 DEAD/DEAH box helicase [Planctomycetota bacterium]
MTEPQPGPSDDPLSTESTAPTPEIRFKGFRLYAFQVEAIRAIEEGRSVIVAAPTGAGKTIIAEYAIEKALREGTRVVYTSPVKALSNQKYRDFNAAYPDRIGIMTGDVTLNPGAPVLIMTTEIFRNTIFEDESRFHDVAFCIFDEIHYMDDEERGTVWEESIIFAPPSIRFVCLSATIANLDEFARWIEDVRASSVQVVKTLERPVPLKHYLFVEELGVVKLNELKSVFGRGGQHKRRKKFNLLDHVQKEKLLPCLYFSFSRRDCELKARENMHRDLLDSAERERILRLFDDLAEQYKVASMHGIQRLRRLVSRGVAFHHAGMLPTFKEIVERLFTSGLLRLLFTTETFALGVNMPARTVAFNTLRKFNGVTFEPMSTLDYYQMAGRAGRQGIDTVGYVYALVDLKWDSHKSIRNTVYGRIEPILSRFNLSYSTILTLYQRMGNRIFKAVEKSFGSVQKTPTAWKRDIQALTRKLGLLKDCYYVDGTELTEKGLVAASVNGYEIHIAELFSWDYFRNLDEDRLILLFTAIVFEPRRYEYHTKVRRELIRELKDEATKVIVGFQRKEKQRGLDDTIRDVNFDMSGPAFAWANGCRFEELRNYTDLSDGDLVRTFRLAIQLMRQARKAMRGTDLRERLGRCMERINRDVIDAERQLQLGAAVGPVVEPDAEPPAEDSRS